MKQPLPFLLQLVRGAIGKEYVIKHYKYGVIRTKYPDMTRIVASIRQRKCRNLFSEAVSYAKEVISDAERKQQWQKRLRRRNGVYNEAIKYHMLKDKRAKEMALLEAQRLIRIALQNDMNHLITDENKQSHKHSAFNNQLCQAIKKYPGRIRADSKEP